MARVLCRLSQPARSRVRVTTCTMGAASPSSVAVGALRLASHKHRTLVVCGWRVETTAIQPDLAWFDARTQRKFAERPKATARCGFGSHSRVRSVVAVRWSEQLQVNSKNYSSCWHPHTRCAATGWFSRRAGARLHGRPRAVREITVVTWLILPVSYACLKD